MFESKFLRRIEANPSEDLARRRDLYHLQLTSSLNPQDWVSLVRPSSPEKEVVFNLVHGNFVENYKRRITTYDERFLLQSIVLPVGCFNKTVYNLCLINRIRYELDYPLVEAVERDWIFWALCLNDPAQHEKLIGLVESKFRN